MSEGHARLSPSNHRWPHCPGSVREEAVYPDIPGEAAIDGTGSHLLLELCLLNGVRAETYDGQIIGANHPDSPYGWLVAPDRIQRVQMCLDYIRRRYDELTLQYGFDAEIKIEAESKSDPGGMFGRDDWKGTCDITITVIVADRAVFIETIDYKDGRGWVHVPGNTQLIAYLSGKLRDWVGSGPQKVRPFSPEKVEACRMTIVQPKTNPVVRYEDLNPADVIESAIKLSDAARATDDPNAPLVPDEKGGKGYCRWCKHKPNCPALGGVTVEKVKLMTNDITTTDGQSFFELIGKIVENVKEIDSEKLAELLDAKPGLDAVFKKIEDEIQLRLDNDQPVPGYAMLPGNSSQEYSLDEEEVVKKLKGVKLKKDQIYPAKLITPPALLKLADLTAAQKERLQKEIIRKVSGKKKLTRVSRDAEKPSVEDMFGAVQKSVAQSTTTPVESTSLFDQPETEISFF